MAKSSYGKNLGKSAKYAAKNIVYTTMPNLYTSANYARDAFKDVREFTIRQKNRINLQRKRQTQLFKPVTDIINNAKEDLKTGKLYNEDRIAETQSQSMNDFLDYADDSASDNGLSMSAFNDVISTSSAANMMGSKSIGESQLKGSEYLGELHQTTHVQNMVFNQKQHLETMSKLTNLETIGKSLVEFNVKTMNEHIKATHSFYNEILNETRELKNSIDKISKNIDSRYGSGGRHISRKNTLDDILSGGFGFNIKAYGKNVKNNALAYLPIDGNMIKEYINSFKASPISSTFGLLSEYILPKNAKKSAGKLDKSIQSLFTSYLQTMNAWKSGKKSGSKLDKIVPEDLQMILGELLGVNLKTSSKPNLSAYKDQALDRNMELKKAKAITEVIPQYLSEITKTLTGKNMYFDMDEGVFKDRNKQRARNERYINSAVSSSMDDTKTLLYYRIDNVNKAMNGTSADREMLEDDADRFITWMVNQEQGFSFKKITNTEALRKEYQNYCRMGLNLRGGFSTYRLFKEALMKLPKAKILQLKNERINAKSYAQVIYDRFNNELQSTGQSALYNGMDTIEKPGRYKLSYDINSKKARSIKFEDNVSEDFQRELKYRQWNEQHPGEEWKNPYAPKSKKKKSPKDPNKGLEFAKKFKMEKPYKTIKGLYNLGAIVTGVADDLLADAINFADSFVVNKGGSFFDSDEDDKSTYSNDPSRSKTKANKRSKTVSSNKSLNNIAKKFRVRAKSDIYKASENTNDSIETNTPNINTEVPNVNIIDYTNILHGINNNIVALADIIRSSIINARIVNMPVSSTGAIVTSELTNMDDSESIIIDNGESISDKLSKAYNNTKENIINKYNAVKPKIKSGAGKAKDKTVKITSDVKNKATVNTRKIKRRIKNTRLKRAMKNASEDDSGGSDDADGASKSKESDTASTEELKKLGFFGKGKNVIVGSALSSMLGLGPVPGIILSSIYNNFKGEKKDKKSYGPVRQFLGKGKNLAVDSLLSSMMGLGPIPGLIFGGVQNRLTYGKKDKSDAGFVRRFLGKSKNYAVDAMLSTLMGLGPIPGLIFAKFQNRSTYGKKEKKEPGKIRRFFGKSKNIGVGAMISSMLGLTPVPGIIAGSIYNKFKYRNKPSTNSKEDTSNAEATSSEETTNDNASEETASEETSTKSNAEIVKDKMKATADKVAKKSVVRLRLTKEQLQKRKDKKVLSDAERMRKAEMAGNQAEADRLENMLINKGKASGDAGSVQKTTDIVANTRNQVNSVLGTNNAKEEKRAPNLLEKLTNFLGGGGGILDTLKSILSFGAAAAVIYKIYNLLKKFTGFNGEDAKESLTTGAKNFIDSKGNINKTNIDTALATGISGKAASLVGLSGRVVGTAVGGAVKTYDQIKEGNTDLAVGTGINTSLKVAKNAAMTIAKKSIKNGTKAFAVKGPISKKIVGALRKTFANKIVQKLFAKHPKLYKKLIEKIPSIADNVAAETVKAGTKNTAKNATKQGVNAAIDASSALGIGIVLNVAIGATAFINGWNNVRNYLRLDPSFEVPTKLKAASAIITCIDESALNGVIDMFGLRNMLIETVYRLIGTKEEKEELTKAKKKQSDAYKSFVEKNPGTKLTEDQYNKITNKTLWGKFTSSLGFGKTLKDYETDGGGVTINNIDNSSNANVVVGGDSNTNASGARGRGITSKSSTRAIMQYAADILNKNKFNVQNTQKFTEEEMENEVKKQSKSNKSTKKKSKKSWLGKIGSWFKSTFSGSGGRGDDPNYYNQGDPRWANQYFGIYNGKRDTVKEGGCGPTVAAMALQELTGHTVTPSAMANLALQAGYKVDNGGTTPDFFNAAGSMYGYNFDTENGISDKTKAALKAGIPVPLLGKDGPYGPGNHYLLANGMDSSGNISILDPQNKRNNKKFSLDKLSKTTKTSMVASGIRGMYGRSRNNRYVKRLNGFMGRSSKKENASDMQLKVVEEALSRVGETTFRPGDANASKGSVVGRCLGLSSDIYAACGYKFTRYADPREVKAKDKTYNTNTSNIPLGATIIWPCKSTHGHCGTYVGDGKVVHAWTTKVELSDISVITNAGYNEMGWSWLGGKSMGSASDSPEINGLIANSGTTSSVTSSSDGGTFIDLINAIVKVSPMSLGVKTNALQIPSLLKTFGNTSSTSDSSSDSGSYNSNGTNTSSLNLDKKTVINKVYNEMKKHGLSHDAAIAILANMNAESGFRTGAIGDSGTSYGLCQWHDTRNTALGKFCEKNGYNKDSIEGQVAYMVSELKSYGMYDKFSKSGNSSIENAKSLAKDFTINFEKPSDKYNKAESRAATVNDYYSINGSGGRGKPIPFLKPGTPSAGSVRETMNGLVPNISSNNYSSGTPTIRVPKYNIKSGRGISVSTVNGGIEIPTNKATNNGINNLNLSNILKLLQNMVDALNDIRNTNTIISEKNTNPVVIDSQANTPSINFGKSQKTAIVDSIISGI